MRLSDLERSVCDAIADGREELVELASALIAFDTTAREVGDPPRQEAALQEHLAAAACAPTGAEIDLFEPDAATLAGAPLVPEGLDFAGRPQLIATLRGAGGGQSLLLQRPHRRRLGRAQGRVDERSVHPRGPRRQAATGAAPAT